MKIIFLYKRLYDKSRKQLEALKQGDLWMVEELTREREELTDEICSIIDHGRVDLDNNLISRKAHELTEAILQIDEQIKNGLMSELVTRNRKHSELEVHE